MIEMSLPCRRLSETSFSILGRQYQGNALIEAKRARGVPDGCRQSGSYGDVEKTDRQSSDFNSVLGVTSVAGEGGVDERLLTFGYLSCRLRTDEVSRWILRSSPNRL